MKRSAVLTLVILVVLMATSFAAIQPQSKAVQDVHVELQDAHFRYYEQLRPILSLDHEALRAACDYPDVSAASAAGAPESYQSAATTD